MRLIGLMWLMAFPAMAQTTATLFSIDDPTQQALLDFAGSAKKQILIADYSFNLAPLVDILVAKHKAGVDVRLVLDKTQAASSSARPLIARLQAAGIPLETGCSRRGHIMHLKIMVVDGRDTFSGSYNMTATAALEENIIDIVKDDPARAARFTKVWQEIWDHNSGGAR